MEATATEPFGATLRAARLAAGLTQEALAERAGVSARNVQSLEAGQNRPQRDTAQHLATALGLDDLARTQFLDAARPAPRHRGEQATALADPSAIRASPPTNLPLALSSFVGRERELAEIAGLLSRTRLLTLTGTGGVGKTRLALQVAAAALRQYPDGVRLVELAALGDHSLVPPAVASAVQVREDPSRPLLASLTEALRPRRLLLVLDNCEHLIAACAELAETLLHACPHLHILATSRETLGLAGETSWRVPSLVLPDLQHLPPVEALVEGEAVRLFVERARAVQPAFTLRDQTAEAVARLCVRLDGIPLALELAAACLRGLSVEQVVARLDRRFQLLTGGNRTALPRQQTLLATVEWSYSLLSPAEQTFFNRLAIFAGGWTLEAAETVCAGRDLAEDDVLGLLLRLVGTSLVLAEEGMAGEMRYRMLETLHQYAHERLVASGEAALIHDRHAAYYMARAERAEPAIHGPLQGRWLDDLEREYSNLRTALAWCLDPPACAPHGEIGLARVEMGMRLATALHFFWWLRQHLREGQEWLERALVHGAAAPAALRAKTLLVTGDTAGELGDVARAQALIAQSVALCREGGHSKELANALSLLGTWTWRAGSGQRAMTVLEEGVACARACGDPWTIAWTLLWITYGVATSAAITQPEARAQAWAAGEESLALFETVGDTKNIAWTQNWLGVLALYEGDYRRARAAFTAELAPLRALGDSVGLSGALASLGDVAREQGETVAAVARYEESLALCHDLGFMVTHLADIHYHLAEIALDAGAWEQARSHLAVSVRATQHWGEEVEWRLAQALAGYGALAAAQGHHRRALQLAGAAAGLREQSTRALSPHDQHSQERRLAPARWALSREEQDAAWAEGRALPIDQAVASALALDQSGRGGPPSASG